MTLGLTSARPVITPFPPATNARDYRSVPAGVGRVRIGNGSRVGQAGSLSRGQLPRPRDRRHRTVKRIEQLNGHDGSGLPPDRSLLAHVLSFRNPRLDILTH